MPNNADKSIEQWLWDAACSIRGAKAAPKYKDYILPLVFAKRLCDVYDDEVNRIAQEVGGRTKAFKLVTRDKKLVRFYIPLQPANADEPVWSIIRKLADKICEQLTTHLRAIADENPTVSADTRDVIQSPKQIPNSLPVKIVSQSSGTCFMRPATFFNGT